nr:hypothetical protein Iba_chr04eCG14310 [Ipomoea batatas]
MLTATMTTRTTKLQKKSWWPTNVFLIPKPRKTLWLILRCGSPGTDALILGIHGNSISRSGRLCVPVLTALRLCMVALTLQLRYGQQSTF